MGRDLEYELTEDDALITHATNFDLPLLDNEALSYQVSGYDKIYDYCSKGYLVCKDSHGNNIFVANNTQVLAGTANSEGYKVTLARKKDFHYLLKSAFSRYNSSRALYHLDFLSKSSASKNINYNRIVFILLFSMWLIFSYAPFAFHFLNNMVYLLQNMFKTLLFITASGAETKDVLEEEILDYPVYTILLPVYKEEVVIHSLVKAIDEITYPKAKLDVKIIVEEDDSLSLRAIQSIKLPEYIHVIKVPYSLPRTKPKALNYAMQYAKGEYAVIYDAEDRPDPDQLLKVIRLFSKLPEQYACVQAKLNFYNRDENLLTKLFSIEYSLWFDFILRGLGVWQLPITLGGTSNHFKVRVLKDIGCWDAYNVTEDADLGIRLYLRGFRTAIVDSYTMEESPVSVGNWMQQRARWVKGFMQTFIVYLKYYATAQAQISKMDHIAIFIFVGLGTYSFLILPWLIITAAFLHSTFLKYMLLINTFFALSYMYGVALTILIKNRGSCGNFRKQDIVAFILWPAYFILHTIASYRAIFELVTDPFKWNKTAHGLSSYTSFEDEIFDEKARSSRA